MVRTAFHLDSWQNKNIVTLLKAIKRISPQFPALRLEIAGGGSPKAIAAIAAMVAKLGLQDRVRLVGPIAPEEIQTWFREAAVFALPALRESFGMVFAEALLAGTPVIYPKGAAIEGFFLDRAFATCVIAQDPRSVADALASMLTRQAAAKADLAAAQQAGELNRFRRNEVLNAYTRFLRQACLPTSA
jgi:glycosyltransferase involved in cell wall biosynthesis